MSAALVARRAARIAMKHEFVKLRETRHRLLEIIDEVGGLRKLGDSLRDDLQAGAARVATLEGTITTLRQEGEALRTRVAELEARVATLRG